MASGLRTSLLVLIAAGVIGWALPRRIAANIIQRIKTICRGLASLAVEQRKVVLLLIWVVALIPMIYLLLFVRRYGVNVPIFDDWAMAPLIVKAHTGQLRVADIFQQQQEARTVLPNLIFILSAWHEWNVRDQMVISIVGSGLTAAGIFVLLRQSRLNLPTLAICFWLIVLTLFSPAPFELWLFASGFPSFLPLLFLVAALTIVEKDLPILGKFLSCAAMAAASTFTLPHGLLAWGLTFPAVLILRRPLRWRSWLGLWSAAAAICAAIYFWGYEKPAYLPPFAPKVALLDYVRFILEFLGSGLAYSLNRHAEAAATIFGFVQVAFLIVALFITVRRFRDREFVAKVVPWFSLALFSLGSAFLAALGRVGFGVSYAISSRYVPFSLGLTVAVVALTGLLVQRLGSGPLRTIIATLIVLAYLVPYRVAAKNTLFFLRHYSAEDRVGKSALLFSQVIDVSGQIKRFMFPPRSEHVVRNATALDDLKLLRPPLAGSNRLETFPHEIADGSRAAGSCEAIVEKGESYQVSGWAILKAKRRQADGVAVFAALPGTEPTLVALSNSVEMRWDIARVGWPNDYLWAGWRATFPRNAVPAGAKLTFWSIDADEPRLYRLEEKLR
jgi:hypothetical protein